MHGPHRNRGVVSILAMLFLVIFSALAVSMAIVSGGNLRTAETHQRVNHSLAAAETGMVFIQHHIDQIAGTIYRSEGEVDEDLVLGNNGKDAIWPEFRDKLLDEVSTWTHFVPGDAPYSTTGGTRIELGRIPVSDEPGAPTFRIIIDRHRLKGDTENYDADFYKQYPYNVGGGENRFTLNGEPVSQGNKVSRVWVRIRSVGEDGDYRRAVQTEFRIDKKVRFAILSRNRVMIGRNVIIRGPIGSRYTHTQFSHGHPIHMKGNFHGLDDDLDAALDTLRDDLIVHDADHDNRINLNDPREADGISPEFDATGDGYIDAFDFFLIFYGEDGRVTMADFQDSGGDLIDRQLWELVNEAKYPPGTQFDWDAHRVRLPGGDWTDASGDLTVIDADDGYAKLGGQVLLAASKAQWEDGAADGPYQYYFEGPVQPEPDDPPLIFEAGDDALTEFDADSFDTSTYAAMAIGSLEEQAIGQGAPVGEGEGQVFEFEEAPFGSPQPYDYYSRPVYEGLTFENVTIPKGTNALFVDCKFIGVTFVETSEQNGDPNYNFAGVQHADGEPAYPQVDAEVFDDDEGAWTTVDDTKPYGNNLRFDNCTFEGVVVSSAPEAYTHHRNKLQFTGRVRFDLDSPNLTEEQRSLFRRSTLFAPQYSVDMGTFTDPLSDIESVQLDGTIVAGVFDIRGQAVIDGSIISTYDPQPDEGPLLYGGNPATLNTTIGYFEPVTGDGEGGADLQGRGKILIRYDPERSMPDGILAPIEFVPYMATYREGI